MKSLQAHNLKTIVLTKAIRNYDEQAFNNTSEESEKKKTLSFQNHCGLFQVKGMVEQAKKDTWWLQTPARLSQEMP